MIHVWVKNDWYIAHAIEIDIASQGKSAREALFNLNEAVELYYECRKETREQFNGEGL